MNIGMKMYELLSSLRPLPFTMSDVLLILFLHDIEKPWKYGNKINKCDENFLLTKEDKHNFRVNKLKEYNIKLTPDQVNAFKYTEGELCDYTSKKRVMNQLAVLCHLADITSARIWHDYPKQTEDPWSAI